MPRTASHSRDKVAQLITKYQKMSREDRARTSEASVVHQFLDPLLEALGWPIQDPQHYKYELFLVGGRPDMILIPDQGGTIFVEAKRFGVIKDLQIARQTMAGTLTPGQLALPGMAADRTREEQQAINYAFENNGTWAILSNFERLRLFNARRDWLVLTFERPDAYLDEFDLLWLLSYDSVCQGELDRLSDQRHRADVDTDYLAFINDWRERLARDIVASPRHNPWAFLPDGRVDLAELRAVVQRLLDRLVVVRFAEDHLVIPPGTLYSLLELRERNRYTFSLSQFLQQFYRRFDEFHDSALFAPHLADQAVFGDEVLAGLIKKLYEARYRALSADIMGNTYEQYLGKTLVQRGGDVTTADNLETRKKQGSYYTPQVIVRYLVDNSLGRYLYGTANGRPDGEPVPGESRRTAQDIRGLRVLDPASGSGSFLIYAYEVLAGFYRSEIGRLERERDERYAELVRHGVTTPLDIRLELTPWTAEIERLHDYPGLIVQTHLYGVDLDPQAAEIATVNLMMRAMADQGKVDRQLPLILNQNIKVGNSLIGAGPADPRCAGHAADLAELRRLRLKLATLKPGPDHDDLLRASEAIDARLNAALDQALAAHFADVQAHRPFNWPVEFPEVFLDEAGRLAAGGAGFQIVVGNPPWEIVKPDLREFYAQFDPDIESRLNRQQVERRIAELNAEEPAIQAALEAQLQRTEEMAAYYRKSGDYIRQGHGDIATHKLFLERAYGLLAHGGRLAFVIPSGIYTDLGTKPLREMLLNEGNIQFLFSFSNERFFFPEVHHSFKFVLFGAQRGQQSDGFEATFRFNPRVAVAPADLSAFLANPSNLVYIERESLERFSPDSLSIMEFQSQRDAEVTARIYSGWPLIGADAEDRWRPYLNREFDMTNDRALFNQQGEGYPLYEGKMIHQFDSYYSQPEFWVSVENATRHFRTKKSSTAPLDYDLARLGFREIARPTDSRTLIAAILPPASCCNHKISVVSPSLSAYRPHEMLFSLAILNSFVLDFITRFKITTGVSMFHFYQLPLPRLTPGNPYFDAIVPRAARLTCTRPEFAALWQQVMGGPWDDSKGAADPAERQALRDELDALVAHLYGLSRADLAHILDTFPLVFPPTGAGQARQEHLLAVYDAWQPRVEGWARA